MYETDNPVSRHTRQVYYSPVAYDVARAVACPRLAPAADDGARRWDLATGLAGPRRAASLAGECGQAERGSDSEPQAESDSES